MKIFRKLYKSKMRYFVNISDLKNLRTITGSPLGKCKEALEKFDNIEEATNYLKEKNLIFASKKASRKSNEGVLTLNYDNNKFQITQINSETDFVSKNDDFLDFSKLVSNVLLNENFNEGNNMIEEKALQEINTNETTLWNLEKQLTAKIQENIKITKVFQKNLKSDELLGYYVHKEFKQNIGPIISYLIIESDLKDLKKLKFLANEIAVHILCSKPAFISKEEISEEIYNEKKNEIIENLPDKQKNKPKNIIDRIVSGKLNKFFDEDILLNQKIEYNEEEITVEKFLNVFEKKFDCKIIIKEFSIVKLDN